MGLVKGLGLGFRDYVAKAGIVAAKHRQVKETVNTRSGWTHCEHSPQGRRCGDFIPMLQVTQTNAKRKYQKDIASLDMVDWSGQR